MALTPSGQPAAGYVAPLHSPVLANIYLHYVLDLWIEKRLSREYRGKVIFMRYADDIIVGFERKDDAADYLRRLPDRLGKFSLRLAAEKSGLVKFNRWEPDTSGRFTFIPPSSGSAVWLRHSMSASRQGSLGFEFYWSRTRKNRNHTIVKRKTSKKKYRSALRAMKEWIRKGRSKPLKEILASLRKRLQGYWNYYGVIGNSRMTWKFYREVTRIVYKWLNRRSQRQSYTWARFGKLWGAQWGIPRPRICEKQQEMATGQLGLV